MSDYIDTFHQRNYVNLYQLEEFSLDVSASVYLYPLVCISMCIHWFQCLSIGLCVCNYGLGVCCIVLLLVFMCVCVSIGLCERFVFVSVSLFRSDVYSFYPSC